jgi:sacsin
MSERQGAAAALMQYCLQDMGSDASLAAELHGLQLVPMLDGSIATLRLQSRGDSGTLLLLAMSAQQLNSFGPAMSSSFLAYAADSLLGAALLAVTKAVRCNIQPLTVTAVGSALLPRLLPAEWHGQSRVQHTPELEGHPSLAWLQQFWSCIQQPAAEDMASALAALQAWPLIPSRRSTAAGAPSLLCAPSAAAQLLQEGSWTEPVSSALLKLGCSFVDAEAWEMLPVWVRQACVAEPTGSGVLGAIRAGGAAVAADFDAAGIEPEERDAVRAFMIQVGKLGRGGTCGSRHMLREC